MFSLNDLSLIVEMSQEAVTNHRSALPYFDTRNKVEKMKYDDVHKQIARQRELQKTCDAMQRIYENVDADYLVDALAKLARYHQQLNKQIDNGEVGSMDYSFEKYMIGLVQSRLEFGLITEDDITMLDSWFEKLED